MRAVLPLLICLASPAPAQTVFDAARGQYGSATDPATSCAANPHQLDFIADPPHLVLDWRALKAGQPGLPRQREVYDIEGHDDSTLTLREEGDYRSDPDQVPFWVLQLTQTPPGYCWHRPDWPQVRCEDQQLACENATS